MVLIILILIFSALIFMLFVILIFNINAINIYIILIVLKQIDSVIHMYMSFHILFHYGLSQDFEFSAVHRILNSQLLLLQLTQKRKTLGLAEPETEFHFYLYLALRPWTKSLSQPWFPHLNCG